MALERNFFTNWYGAHGREFPWRKEGTTPFAILATEMLLRQTRAGNVASIWKDFILRFGSPQFIVAASKRDLLKKLRVLGFGHQRVAALRAASNWLIENHEGRVPNSLGVLLQIPHIGEYSARAVLCFAFKKKVEIVDTNVLRLFSRYFGVELKPDIRRAPEAWEIAKHILPRRTDRVRDHNYGLLDFTATVCKPGKPRCESCPLSSSCAWALRTKSQKS